MQRNIGDLTGVERLHTKYDEDSAQSFKDVRILDVSGKQSNIAPLRGMVTPLLSVVRRIARDA